jgi:hypothetical protein
MYIDQTAMGLPPATSTVFLIANSVWLMCLGGISEMSLLSFGIKRDWYVCKSQNDTLKDSGIIIHIIKFIAK